ncbi:membrane protein insertion efficiency factor YidD [Candidatus Dependentiae bacterium]|nr:membrane protein insertion efficiency factor YidD [Candidatus Dependentiae bacterium]
MVKCAVLVIKFYQISISKVLPSACRFYPSCSDYAIKALNKYGILKGSYLSLYRLFRCHPFCDGGVDDII